ncbi:hypothetical protein [Streptomyces zagrosensis]|uniref:Uncharacterized protein n=1 Tax=Streptomyces zagrosensis TaxID=1042984 RepID=A0A7W9V1Q1_9ACTN|nr:hypothetical protein [Streptomyces zagrosensis]MBB5939528.1 hypothetical protein [Streptomyces zagrosensis]
MGTVRAGGTELLEAGGGAVGEWLAMSGRALSALRSWAGREPHSPLAVALWAYADAERLGRRQVRAHLQSAHAAAGQAPARTSGLDHIHQLVAEGGGWAEVFHTFQLALAAVAADTDALQAMAERARSDRRPDYHQVLAPVIQALAHMTAGRPGKAVALLTPLGQEAERVGGVRVEREIIQDTLTRALIDTGQMEQAAHLLHHRITHRRHHTYETLLLTPRPTTLRSPAPAPAGTPRYRPDPTR